MSLDAIRKLRRVGLKPGSVMVVLGDRPRWVEDDEVVVFVRPCDDPRFMDWRPLFGVAVAVFTMQPQPDRTLAVLDGLTAVSAKFVGAADQSGFYPLLESADESVEVLLRKAWRLLCLP